jgi:hypothetical protein
MFKFIIGLLLVGYVNSLTFDKKVDLENPNVNKIVINNDILYVYDKLTMKILSLKNINCYGYICNNKLKQVICYKDANYNYWKCGDNIFNIILICTDDCRLYSNYLIHYKNYFKSNESLSPITKNILFSMNLFYIILIIWIMMLILYQIINFLKYLLNIILDCDYDAHFDDIYTRRKPSKK